ncbi:LytR C-terminal domain-containing protein [Gordonia sp. TBRC 11910]|uniref:LytR C-terminal domain-containing protein n=1 Tax=Gordonia asplenii TaxID=2725283 RepID=A0A848L010_9ACTN|nr:LytR C-terminal domain-containing protein [Gordonia asplenii]NMO04166.1 LytR C-terminal domain-containing protein [Gordonia asplenii]
MNADREPNHLPLRAGAMLLLAIAVACIGLGWHSAVTSGKDPEQALDRAGASAPITSTPVTSAAPTSAAASTTVKLCVFNAGSVHGLAREVTDELKAKGYHLASPANLTTSSFSENTVFYDSDGDAGNTKAEAQKVAKDMNISAVEERPSSFTQCAYGIPVIVVARS